MPSGASTHYLGGQTHQHDEGRVEIGGRQELPEALAELRARASGKLSGLSEASLPLCQKERRLLAGGNVGALDVRPERKQLLHEVLVAAIDVVDV